MTRTLPSQAFILTAGKGTRLRPYTNTMPKPMVPVRGKPILFHTLDKLEKSGISNIVMNTHYFGDMIKEQTSAYSSLSLGYSHEEELLDTGGGAKQALCQMKEEPFYMINGDAFWEDSNDQSAFERLAAAWDENTMDILILLQPVNNMHLTQGIGDYNLIENGRATRSKDKSGDYMFAGIRITKPSIIKNVQRDHFSFLELMDKAEEQGRLYGLVHDNEWHHISTPEDLEAVNQAGMIAPQKAQTA
ncbi:MAG: nucleotidyltransferase family protein [Pseudomonadota bacterium]